MSCTTLTIECFKAAYTANVGYDSLFCGLKVTCDSNVKYIRAPYVADFNGNTLMLHGWDKSETVIDDVTVTGLSVAQVKDLVATCCCGDDQHLIVNNTPVGYIPTTSGNTSNLNEVVIDSGGDTWIIDINGDARKFNKGTVTSFSAGNLSPLFTTNVATPTTTPALSFNLSNCNQYQVFGRVASGTGVPSYVSLNPIAFNGLAIPNQEVAFGTGTGISSSIKLKYNGTYLEVNNSTSQGITQINSSNIIVGSNHGYGTYNSYLRLNATQASSRATGISIYNSASQDHWWFGTAYSSGNFHLRIGNGNDGAITGACRDDGSATTNSVFFIPRTTTEFHVSNTLTVHHIPTASSATDILVSNGGVVSTRTVASLGIPVITPSALTKTDDTNVTISLGGTPATALLQGVSLTMGWAGVLAITRGGTGLGSLGTANQLLRVNTGETALEYFTPTWTTNTGTVTSFSAGNLSPLFTTNVATPTTTPALSFNLSNCNQYQVFGRVVAGTGAPSYVTLNPIAFNGLSLPNNQIAYGTGSGISSNGNLKYNGNSGLQIGGGTNTAYCAINIGNGVITNNSGFSFVLTENTANVISGPGNAVASFIIGSGNTITTGDITSSAYHNNIFGSNNSISAAPSKGAYYNFISGRDNIVTDGYYNNILGHNVTNNGYSGCLALTDYGGSITLTASNQFTARFSGGYRFMKDGSTQWMAIAPTTGYVTINNIPTAASATDILVSNGGVVSTRTVASLGIGGGSAVWYIQGTATDATTNAQDIVRTGKVRIGASGTSTYMLSVVGNAYIMNGVEINNNQSYKGFNTSATAVNLIKINSSNYVEVGQSSYDIYLANYTSGRSADTVTTSDKYLYVNSSGYLKAESAQWVRNDGASAYITSSESHAADSTDRKVKFDVAIFANNGYYGLGGSSGDYRINFPSGYTFHFVVVTLEYTTSGTPTVTATLRRVSTTIETNVSTSADGRKVMTIHTMMSGSGTSDYPTVYLSVSGSAITLQKCRMTVIPMGAVPP